MRSCILRIVLFLLGIFQSSVGPAGVDTIADGRADLSQWNPQTQALIELQGQWEFYWSQLLTPEDFKSQMPKNRSLIKVPGSWNHVTHFPVAGFATYRLQVSLSDISELAIYFPPIASSSRVYIDDKLVTENGRVGVVDDKKFYEVSALDKLIIFTPSKKNFEIIVQVSNYEYFLAGIPTQVKLGSPHGIFRDQATQAVTGTFLLGCLFIMGIYHLCLYALRKKGTSTLYFGLTLLFCCSYLLGTNSSCLSLFLPERSTLLVVRLIISFVPMIICLAYFAQSIFPKYYSKRLPKWVAWICWPIYGLLMTGLRELMPLSLVAHAAAVAVVIYTVYGVSKAIRARENGSILFAVGSGILVLVGVHDLFQSMGVIQSIPLFSIGLFLFIFFQSVLLARRFSNAFLDVEKSEREISLLSDELRIERDQVLNLNENLELKVEEKTRDIRSIMTHIPLGVFAITADQYKIHKDYSEHLRELFEVNNLSGMNACPLLFDSSQLSSDEKSQAISVFDACLGEDMLMFEMNAHSLPRELRRRKKAGDERIFDLTWNPIAASDGCVEKILVTLRDVTELRALEEDAHDKQEELQFIGELISVQGQSFRRFINSCRDFIAENRKLLRSASIERADLEVLKVLFINMHTMKGAARSLYFKKMTRIFHDVEQYYANLQKDPHLKWDLVRMNRDMDEVEAIVAVYNEINRIKLGRKTDDEKDIELPESQVIALYQNLLTVSIRVKHIQDNKTQAILRDVRSWIFPKIFTSVRETIVDCCLCVDTLAKDLEKAKPMIALSVPNIYLNHRGDDLLRKIFVHILRNALDHGLERPLERVALGKNPQGVITITLNKIAGGVEMQLSDDGRGLNIKKIKAIGEDRGLISPLQEVTVEQVAELIFCAGLSTTGKVNEVSGRGIGMEAVRKFLLQQDGNITVQLLAPTAANPDFYPFIFQIYLPDALFAATHEEGELKPFDS